MPNNFYQKELRKTQDRFNETFGVMTVCNLKTRQIVILSIISLGRLCEKIQAGGERDLHNVREFMRTRDAINKIFEQIERGRHEKHKDSKKHEPGSRRMHGVG